MIRRAIAAVLLLAATPVFAAEDYRAQAQQFLDLYNSIYLGETRLSQNVQWDALTNVSDLNEGRQKVGAEAFAIFAGDRTVIATTKKLLAHRAELEPLQARQLDAILLIAADSPGTIPEIVSQRIAAEAHQSSVLNGWTFCLAADSKPDGSCAKPITANDIDNELHDSKKLEERLLWWQASKEDGRALKPGLVELQRLRNRTAQELGFSSFFALETANYGMTPPEMMKLLDGFLADTRPLYAAMHVWGDRELAKRYGVKGPSNGPTPAHWYPNRWGQAWPGLVQAVDLDPWFKDRKPEWIAKQAEAFYVSLGLGPLQKSFYEKSDLYPVPPGEKRKKNTHASAWNLDLDGDIRSLQSIEPNSEWWGAAHHELGHIYYYRAYNRPAVPPTLREGANRAFHEGIGELITIAAGQAPYLKQQGILPARYKPNETQFLLNEALEHTVAFMPFSAGTMSHFEYELYEKNLPPDQWQKRWWEMVSQYQGMSPPDAARTSDPALCDACTKTHINDDPAQYYDYAIATVLKYQLHEHIAKKILHQDPHACNYYGNKEVGAFLTSILEKGATEDWRKVLKDATGEDLSTRAMVEYFKPLQAWLDKENKKSK